MKNFLMIVFVLVMVSSYTAAQEDGGKVEFTFEKMEVGKELDGALSIDGEFLVAELDGGKVLELSPVPLVECGLVLGLSLKGEGQITAKIRAGKKRRSTPRFGVGLHGISGYRLRVVPAQKQLELLRNEEVVKTATYDWQSGSWVTVRLVVTKVSDNKWGVSAKVWAGGEKEPELPALAIETTEAPGNGKASIWGTPYSGLPIYYDDIQIQGK